VTDVGLQAAGTRYLKSLIKEMVIGSHILIKILPHQLQYCTVEDTEYCVCSRYHTVQVTKEE
jgi:hypothetical protein